MDPVIITPDWPAPDNILALTTTRIGGVSQGPYASWNLGTNSGDDPEVVALNRDLLKRFHVPAPTWPRQVHATQAAYLPADAAPEADAVWTDQPGVTCAILTADCLPVLFTTRDGHRVAAAHAGWRGLVAGVLEATVQALASPPTEILAWLGPAIGPQAFEVGPEVRAAFLQHDPEAEAAFLSNRPGHWLADLYLLARQRLHACGIDAIHGGNACTWTDAERFFSYRRDGQTGRMASLILRRAE